MVLIGGWIGGMDKWVNEWIGWWVDRWVGWWMDKWVDRMPGK